jgi:tyrosyl-tRNA synthetase
MDVIRLAAAKTVPQMLQRDSFKARMAADDDVYVHEFLYPLMQGYDSVAVESDVELGGTDQTFNNLTGRDIQRAYGLQPQVVITMPILVGLDGREKMSKSKDNYVGVTDEPAEMFGKIMSISDGMMEGYFSLLTDLPGMRIKELADPKRTHPKQAKVLLGKTIVGRFHGDKAAEAAAEHFEKVFARGETPEEMPEIRIKPGSIAAGRLLLHCGLVSSSGEAKRMIKQAGACIDSNRITDPNAQISPADGMVVQVGKRKFARLKVG